MYFFFFFFAEFMRVCFTFTSSSHCLSISSPESTLDHPRVPLPHLPPRFPSTSPAFQPEPEQRRATMAAKAGDNPDSLMTLTTVFCLRNLRKTVCYPGFGNKLCLRPDIFLPSEICDKLVNKYVNGRRFPPKGRAPARDVAEPLCPQGL